MLLLPLHGAFLVIFFAIVLVKLFALIDAASRREALFVSAGKQTTQVWLGVLELDDATLREWDATVVASGPDGIVLDRSAFYPGGGGQPPDAGVLLWGGVQTRVAGARKTDDDVYLIPVDDEPVPPPGTSVRGAVD